MPSDSLPAEVGRSVALFLTAADESAPGLIAGFYLVGSVALGDFHPSGTGRGRLTTASDIDFVAVTDRRLALAAAKALYAFRGCPWREVKTRPWRGRA